MTELSRERHLEQIHIQLEHWQHNLASRVASEAETLDIEIDNLHDNELEVVRQRLHAAQAEILTGCDIVRDLRRELQDRRVAR